MKSMIQVAAEELDREFRPYPWFVSIGISDGTVSDSFHRELIIQTNKNPAKIKYAFPLTICEIPVRVENVGTPRPAIN